MKPAPRRSTPERPVPQRPAPPRKAPLEPPPGLDFRTLGIEKTAGVLRAWAAETVTALFVLETPTSPDRLLEIGLKTGAVRRRSPARFEKRLLRSPRIGPQAAAPPPPLRHPISIFLVRYLRSLYLWAPRPPLRLPGNRFLKLPSPRVPRGLRRDLFTEAFWPESLWPMITTLAWDEPHFQKDAATVIFEHFRRTVPVSGFLPAPVFRPQVFWLLLDLFGLPGLLRPPEKGPYRIFRRFFGGRLARLGWRLWLSWSRRGRLGARLSEIAQTQVLELSGWAGFWEQWLVGEALVRHPEPALVASATSRQLLDLLPLLARRRYRQARNRVALPGLELVATGRGIVDAEWEKARPDWLAIDRVPAEDRRRVS